MRIVLGPYLDRTHSFLLETHWSGTAMGVEDLQPYDVADNLRYSPIARCGTHIQGYGLDVQALSGTGCVPTAAMRGTRFWLHIANLLPQARVVVVRYYHDGP